MPSAASRDVVHATIPVPRAMAHLGTARVDIFLRETGEGHLRWFHGNGSPTVVEGVNVDQAMQVAQLVWSDLQVITRADRLPH
jgi:hypothetical protein